MGVTEWRGEMQRRYRALRVIGTIYKILGVAVGVLTIVAVVGFCGFGLLGGQMLQNAAGSDSAAGVGDALSALVFAAIALVYGAAMSVSLYAVGEGIYLALGVEENTRETARLLQSQSQVQPPVRT
jgi:uncharacterized membrane protein